MVICMSLEVLDYGSYLGVEGHEFIIKQENIVVSRVPFHEAKRAIISSGSIISSTALYWLAQYGVETMIASKSNKIVSVLPSSFSEFLALNLMFLILKSQVHQSSF